MIYHVIFLAIKEFFGDKNTRTAAAISFYVLFSLFPMLICLIWLAGLFMDDPEVQKRILRGVSDLIPFARRENNIVVEAIRSIAEESRVTGLVGFLIMAWSGTRMFRMVREALNETLKMKSQRPFLLRRLTDLGLMLGLGLFFLLSISVTALLQSLGPLAGHFAWMYDLPLLGPVIGKVGFFWKLLFRAVPFVFSTAGFLAIYTLLPAKRKPFRHLLTGSAIAALLFEAIKGGFGYYLKNFGRYHVIFGSLGAVVVFLFWVYLSAMILLFGAQMIAAFSEKEAGPSPFRPGI